MIKNENESECDTHNQSPMEIRRTRQFDPGAFEMAIGRMLKASGIEIDASHTGRTAQRVCELWQKRLLDGYDVDPAEALGAGFDDHRKDMVIIRSIAVHGVCPTLLAAISRCSPRGLPAWRAPAWLWTYRSDDRCDQPPFHVPRVDCKRDCNSTC